MKTDNNQVVISAMIRVCRESLKSFNRRNPQPLSLVLNTAMVRAAEILPLLKPERLKMEILYGIVYGKLVCPEDM